MTQLVAILQHNPFANAAFRRSRKIVFLLDQISKLTALDPEYFSARIALSQAIAEAMSNALATTGSALSQQMGATADSDVAFTTLKRVVGQQFAILQATLGKGNAGLLRIFGRHVTDYTDGLTHFNAVKRLDTLKQNVETNADTAGPVAVNAINDAISAYTGLHGAQTTEKNAVGTSRATAASFDDQLNQVLWQNQTAVIDRYPTPTDEPQRLAAANFALLSPPAPGHHSTTFADYIGAGLTADIDEDDPQPLPAPSTRLVLTNPGPVRLQVALSTSHNDFPSAGIIQEVAPGVTITLFLGDLGDPLALPFLLAHNPTSELGRYQIVLG